MNKSKTSYHWYTQEGQPKYEAGMKEARGVYNKETKTTIGQLLPSVTTITSQWKTGFGLDKYKRKQDIMAALTLPRLAGETDDDFIDRVCDDAKEDSSGAADFGSTVHNLVEKYLPHVLHGAPTGCEHENKQIKNCVENILSWCSENLMDGVVELIKTDLRDGYAGKIDFLGKDKDGQTILVDFKTQRTSPKTKDSKGKGFTYYKSWSYQMSAYSNMCQFPSRCVNVVVSSTEFNRIKTKEWKQEEIGDGLVWFLNMVENYRIDNKFRFEKDF